ncbi:BrnA antitoxin family protein [Geomonas sp. Red32]|uniref:BrnA antitoxin family protein n=1 Tax=Geomonas sp. Red32 TaxID=2912856 RepID=UPI00202CFFEC|nr:BrnA antitoxin family protein [Geomonas sp. Red32]MCM0081866.1 BrnA antitoxin family protein [Geomonas sp. Red32]
MTVKTPVTKNICVDPDDAPELTDEWFEKADLMEGAKVVRRGRPAGRTKALQTVRFDLDVLAAFKATGKGWQTRMNDALREWLKEHPLKQV